MSNYGVIVTKSTVPVGTAARCDEIEQALARNAETSVGSSAIASTLSSPERKGAAIDDFLNRSPTVL
jgi:UDPglucose 6-dehydrogenase